MGDKIDRIIPINNMELQIQLKYLGNSSNAIDKDIVVVGEGENLARSSIVPSGWKNSTTIPSIFEGTGSIFSSPSIMMHIFPLTFNKQHIFSFLKLMPLLLFKSINSKFKE